VVIFTITKNRAPVIDSIGNQTAIEDIAFSLTINASDADGDTLTFSDNTSLFGINSSTGLISFTPNASQVGVYQIQINATDDDNATDSANFWLNISEVNDLILIQYLKIRQQQREHYFIMILMQQMRRMTH